MIIMTTVAMASGMTLTALNGAAMASGVRKAKRADAAMLREAHPVGNTGTTFQKPTVRHGEAIPAAFSGVAHG